MLLYQAADGGPALDVRLEQDTVWLTQAQLVELFHVISPSFPGMYATFSRKVNCRRKAICKKCILPAPTSR